MALSKLTSVSKSVAQKLIPQILEVSVSPLGSLSELSGFTGTVEGQQVSLKSMLPDSGIDGGVLYWKGSQPKSSHDGVEFYSPTVPFTMDLADYKAGAGETDSLGNGCWVQSVGYKEGRLKDDITAIEVTVASHTDQISTESNRLDVVDGRIDSSDSLIASQGVDIDALQAGQGAGVVGYALRSELFSNLNYADKTIGYVTNDPVAEYNGTYRKSGASGAGSWVLSSNDLASSAYQKAVEVANNFNSESVGTPSTYGGNLEGENNLLWFSAVPTIVETANPELKELGIDFITSIPVDGVTNNTYIEYEFSDTDSAVVGDWFAYSFFLESSDGIYWGDDIRVYSYKTARNTIHKTYQMGDLTYEQITGTLRKYTLVGKLDTGNEKPFAVRLYLHQLDSRTASVNYTGLNVYVGAAKVSTTKDSWETLGRQISRVEAIADLPFVDTMFDSEFLIKNLQEAVASDITDPTLLSYRLTTQMVTPTDSVNPGYVILPVPNTNYKEGDTILLDFFLMADDFAPLSTTRFRLLCFDLNEPLQIVKIPENSYTVITPTIRRYSVTLEIPAGITNFSKAWFEVTSDGTGVTPIYTAGISYALSKSASRLKPFSFTPSSVEVGSEDLDILYSTDMFLVEDNPLPIYSNSVTSQREAASPTWNIFLQGMKSTYDSSSFRVAEPLLLDGKDMVGSCDFYGTFKKKDSGSIKRLPVKVHATSGSKTGSPAIAVIGDSLTYEKTTTFMRQQLEASGLTPVFIGTYADQLGTTCEGRSSWETSDFTRRALEVHAGTPTYPIDAVENDGTVKTAGDYLGLPISLRWKYNPFIRPSDVSDDPAMVYNGFTFDYRFYLDRFSLPDPEIVTIALGTNDIASNANDGVDRAMEGLNVMYTRIREALPAAKIAIVLNSVPSETSFIRWESFIREVITTYGGRSNEGLYVLPLYAHRNNKTIYGINVTTTDGIGMETGIVGDWVHAGDVGRAQWAKVLHHFIMNMVN